NNHVPMNTNQKAFTYLYNFAGYIRRILESRFFLDCSNYTETEKTKGLVERVVVETVMCTNYLNDWKKQTKAICKYLNQKAADSDFEKLAENLCRLEKIITDDMKDIFNSKDSFIFLTLFDKFTKLDMEDSEFAGFLTEFKNHFRSTKMNGNGLLFDEIDKDKGTKDKAVIISKLDMLEKLMLEYLHIENSDEEEIDTLDFVKKNVNPELTREDVELYEEVLDDLTLNVDNSSKLMDKQNRTSLVAIVAYSFKNDIDLDEWIVDYFKRNDRYIRNINENFIHMKRDLDEYVI
ncbi:MAG: DUF262 domain-containing protein, partial [Lachnospiraceae bacterium]|nr:DUF262 domain-containing protein [Lachnospiraceae bacterium]